MKKTYNAPEMTPISLQVLDVITMSLIEFDENQERGDSWEDLMQSGL